MASTCSFVRTWARAVRGCTVFAVLAATAVANAQGPSHPMDGLTAQEISTATAVLHAAAKTDSKTRFPMIQLKEPPKEEVLAWKPGQAMRREAFVMVEQGQQVFEAVVDVNGKKLVSWTEIKGVQPPYVSLAQETEIDSALKENAEIVAGLKKRGITDLNTVSAPVMVRGISARKKKRGSGCCVLRASRAAGVYKAREGRWKD